MDVATWINQQNFLSFAQKRNLIELTKAQQQLISTMQHQKDNHNEILIQHYTAMSCAQQNLSENKIQQLQAKVFANDLEQSKIMNRYEVEVKQLDLTNIQINCNYE